ncbi:MAG: aldehyde ferredoxin oxidoreductase family protein [Anaerolineae bacterium]
MAEVENRFGGFVGKVLRVDLTTGSISVEEPDEVTYRRYGGCGGLAAYYLLRELPVGVDPLGAENVMVFMTGAMNGTPLWGANRFLVATKSALTLSYGESEAGGWWGPELKAAGFDGIIIKGKAASPVYLWIKDGQAEIRAADQLWGRSTGEVQDTLLEETGDKRTRVLQCGPAAERGVRFAALTNDLRHWNGRCGMGAVMAAKNLRAIAVRGTGKVRVADEERVKEVLRWLREHFKRSESTYHLYGTARSVMPLNQDGIFPTRNFREGQFEAAEAVSGQTMSETILTGRGTCYACAIACKREVAVPELGVTPKYGGPEYETIGALGSLCGIGDLKLIARGNQTCGEYGLDTISTGVCIAFAMECFERGILTSKETNGLDLRFGTGQAMLEMIHRIGKREGLGDLLAEGLARAAKSLGPEAEKLAMHVKGQEVPVHEPRGKRSLALAYACSPTGGDHMEAPHDPLLETLGAQNTTLAPLSLIEPVDRMDLSYRKVRAYYMAQLLWGMYNVVGMCDFAGTPLGPITLPKLADYYSAVTGWETGLWEMLRLAQRASTMYRMFNVREGFTPDDDTLPVRFFQPLENGPLAGEKVDPLEFDRAKRLFYEMSGWDADTGVPKRATLLELELEWLL